MKPRTFQLEPRRRSQRYKVRTPSYIFQPGSRLMRSFKAYHSLSPFFSFPLDVPQPPLPPTFVAIAVITSAKCECDVDIGTLPPTRSSSTHWQHQFHANYVPHPQVHMTEVPNLNTMTTGVELSEGRSACEGTNPVSSSIRPSASVLLIRDDLCSLAFPNCLRISRITMRCRYNDLEYDARILQESLNEDTFCSQ